MAETLSTIPAANRPPLRVYNNSASLIDIISRAVANPAMDVAKMQALLNMHETLAAREAEQAFNAAMREAQSQMRRVTTDARNDSTRSRYATYAALDTAVRQIYVEHGFSLSFNTGEPRRENEIKVTCAVSHQDGHTRPYALDMPADGKGAKGGDVMTRTHATGSALSYGKRYLLILIFNITTTDKSDDDGNAAGSTDNGGRISEAQTIKLKEMIDTARADTVKLCLHFNVETLSELPAKAFPRALDMLQVKIKQQQRTKSDAG